MKSKTSIALIFVLVIALLASPASATAPAQLTITADLYLTGQNSASGSFETSGLFAVAGDATEEFFTAANTIHGVKTLVGAEGTITISFQAQLTWTGPTNGVTHGRFVILSGTGAYDNLHGVGDTYAELDLSTGHLVATYTGKAHFD